jgi:hypothetical protein
MLSWRSFVSGLNAIASALAMQFEVLKKTSASLICTPVLEFAIYRRAENGFTFTSVE